jgi:hypothetical protein
MKRARNGKQAELHAGFLLGFLFHPDDGGDTLVDFQRTIWRYIPDRTLHNN